MKWIGQHIWSFISRFRSDVYLEDLSDHGSDPDRFLTADSSTGKVTYRTGAEVLSDIGASSESTDLEFSGATANGLLTYGGAAQIDVESTATLTTETFSISSSTSSKPSINLYNSHVDANPSKLQFNKQANGAAEDEIGEIVFIADNAVGVQHTFANIVASIADAGDGVEAGKLEFNVAEYDGTSSTVGLLLDGDTDADGEIDATIGAGVASLTTIAGDLDIDGDNVTAAGALTITPGGTFTVAGGSNEIDLTTTGTLDVNANALDMDLTDSSSITLTSSEAAEDLLIRVAGATDSSLILSSTGTGTDAIHINATAGSIDIDSADNITIDAADLITITTADTGADGKISLVSGVAGANTSIHLDGNAHASSEVQIDAGILDIDVTGAATIDTGGATTITAAGTAELAGSTVTLDSAANIELEVGATSNFVQTTGLFRGGNIGNIADTFIPLMPIDFVAANSYRNPGSITGSGRSMTPSSDSKLYYAMKIIPNGYTATACIVNGVDAGSTGAVFICYQGDIDGTAASALASATALNSSHDFGANDIVGNGEKFCIVEYDPGDTSDIVYGGKITIAKTV